MRRKLAVLPWRTHRSHACPGAFYGARLCRTLTEIEHRDDGAFKRYLPGPKTGGFARGSFIAWRRHEWVRDIEVVKDSIRELYDFEEAGKTMSNRKEITRNFSRNLRSDHWIPWLFIVDASVEPLFPLRSWGKEVSARCHEHGTAGPRRWSPLRPSLNRSWEMKKP